MLPGAGQLYLGQRVLGAVYLIGFVAGFAGIVVLFFRGYGKYLELTTSGGFLDANNLERLGESFPFVWMVTAAGVAVVAFLASLLSLRLPDSQNGK